MSISDTRLGPSRLALALILALLPLCGCVEHAIQELARPRDFGSLTPPPSPTPKAGAIWRGETSGGSFLYYDKKARGLGDVVTVFLLEDLSAEGSANTKTDSSSTLGATLTSDIGFTSLLPKLAKGFFGLFGVTVPPDKAPGVATNVLTSNTDNNFDGKGVTKRSGKFSGTVTCRVVEVLPGDLLHLYGRRQIIVNHDLQLVTIEGVVRKRDISIDNTVPSTLLADARLTYDGLGTVDDKQRPASIGRLLDWVYPF